MLKKNETAASVSLIILQIRSWHGTQIKHCTASKVRLDTYSNIQWCSIPAYLGLANSMQ